MADLSGASSSGSPSLGSDRSRKRKLPDCEHCVKNPGRYRCPGCEFISCSVSCSRAHKESSGCTGKRSRTRYISLKQFDDAALRSDYGFLEEALKAVDSTRRIAYATGLVSADENPGPKLPAHLKRLARAAKERAITLRFMPEGMTRRAKNTTTIEPDSHEILWCVEIEIVGEVSEVVSLQVRESMALDALLAHLLSNSTGSPTFASLRERQAPLARAISVPETLNVSVVRLQIYTEDVAVADRWCTVLDLSASLGGLLSGRTIVEFPVFRLLLQRPSLDLH